MNKHKLRNFLLAMMAGLTFLAACEPEEELEGPDRLFRPVAKGELVSEGNWLQANWYPIKSAKDYKVELSQDTFKTILQSLTVDTSTVLFENLIWDAPYQVRVQANAEDPTKTSGIAILGYSRTAKFPTILKAPNPQTDVTEAAIKVNWTNSGAVPTSIKVLNAATKALVKEVPVTSQDVANQYRIITGLPGSTTYLVEIYSGTTLRGYDNYTTKTPLSGNLVDLREITGKPSALADTILDVPAGSTIILKRGQTYNVASGISLSKSVTILSGTDLLEPNLATIFFTSNFNFAAGSNIEYIDFKDVVLRGNAYGSNYVFNTTGGATVGRISFESVRATTFRGVARIQSGATTITNFQVNNSTLDSLAGYGVLTVDNATCKVENISIRNSTIYKAEKVITSRQNSTSVLIENCTINEAPWGGNYLVDYSISATNNVTNGIKIYNNIFGIGKSNAGNRQVRGYRANANTNVDVMNTFTTSDHVVASNPFPNTIPYSKTSFDLFQDPKAGNFRIKDTSFAGKATAGDPRWRP